MGSHSLTPVSRCWVAMAVNLCSEKFANMFQILLQHLPSFKESLSNKKDTETNALNLTTYLFY